jgi:cell division protein FtsI (penicillin-binding protein 3)
MARPTARIRVLELGIMAGLVLVVGRAAQLQLVEGRKWAAQAREQRTVTEVLRARRGTLYDRHGGALALTQEFYRVGVAPNELREPSRAARAVAVALGLPAGRVRQDIRTRRWVYYGGPYSALQVDSIRQLRGVYAEGTYLRNYPARELARGYIGAVRDSGVGASGLELALDSLLTGVPGEAVMLRTPGGRRLDSPSRVRREPVPGNDVVLTLDGELQEIAEFGLDEAIAAFDAEGGDVVILDPFSGEILAVASRQQEADGRLTSRPTAFTDPFQPGSTAKLFTAAALLELGRVDSTDTVDPEGGVWLQPVSDTRTRRVEDDHPLHEPLTLELAIVASSNIAMAKFAERLSFTQHYEALRSFGFGSPTGVEFPSETRGRLRLPHDWDAYSQTSLAMGYEFTVTPVQLAVAYAAIANGGVIVAPTLVREVRAPDGEVLYRHRPEPVRRALSEETAARLRRYLTGVVGDSGGTGSRARLERDTIAGKTGTARRMERGKEGHVASFAAIYPVRDPQLVMVVKVDGPKGQIYGGLVAAPLTKSIVTRAMASRRVALDRSRLAGTGRATGGDDPARRERRAAKLPVVAVGWPPVEDTTRREPAEVPSVEGLGLREAVRALHREGFRVAVQGSGRVLRTSPGAGAHARAGSTVTVYARGAEP